MHATHIGDFLCGRRLRQNHALEHATVTLLTHHQPGLAVSARSTARGFTIFADLDAVVVHRYCGEALERLNSGEDGLAIHPRCGTNLAIGASLALIGAFFGQTAQRPSTRIVSAVFSVLAGMAVARLLGRVVQRHLTTLADLHDVRIVSSAPKRLWGHRVVEVLTEPADAGRRQVG